MSPRGKPCIVHFLHRSFFDVGRGMRRYNNQTASNLYLPINQLVL